MRRTTIGSLVTTAALLFPLGAGVPGPASAATAAATQSLRLQYMTTSTEALTDQVEPLFKIVNGGTAPVALSQVKIRYYFKGETGHRFACSWARIRCSTVTGRFVPLAKPVRGADRYLEVGFTSGRLAPGTDTGDLELRFHRPDWRTFDQSDDHSFGAGRTSYADWDRATVHIGGRLVWGAQPSGTGPAPTPTPPPATSTPKPPATSTPKPPATPAPGGSSGQGTLFDDFAYTGPSDARLAQHGWRVRSGGGGPGVSGAGWSPSAITFPSVNGDRVLQLSASTDGTGAGTVQSELSTTRRKFFEGTYAARVKFSDAPVSGPDGEHVVQTFFTITPLERSMDPDYGELDFEYLPNGGWGESGPTMFTTSWETYQAEPWKAVNTHTAERASFAGWHDLVLQVSGGRARYYVDGRLVADHGGEHYPETPMSIMFNQWFIELRSGSAPRDYHQQVDWVYHSRNEVVPPADVRRRVESFRSASTAFVDTVSG
ncbi:cellulose binding domain-containing protein [Planomonospora sp. ID91781]|uniref:cellulose binding domain-containing protein n=1 Tax=Planomonospora sp. ID91781 TaxID=2738135 RepID=UPI001E4EFEB3|nr:cellulose binding domain-containing protein [Planomonospora sp. ID91781]